MAPIKRKREIVVEDARPEKKQKPSSTAKLSILKAEEPVFPRGGASILTPLEHKQIQIQAKQDVLFEQNSGQKAAKNDFEDEQSDVDMPEQPGGLISQIKRKTKAKDRRSGKGEPVEEPSVRIEGLSYKRLVPGSIVLGQVSQINRHDLALSLPNNLTGYVPLTSISDKVSKKLEVLANDEEEAEEESEDKQMDLNALVSPEQYLRAYVTATQHDESTGAKGKRHIALSINPREANAGLTKADLVTNSTVQASVISVEDHGLIMDLGLGDASLRGFVSSKELGPIVDISKIHDGAVYLCLVTGKSSNGNIIKLSADPQKIGNVKKGNYLTNAPTVNSFLPGTGVDILISEVTTAGITGKIMGLLNVTADIIHSGAASSGKDLEKKYAVGSKVKGRIICNFPTVEEKKLGISLQDHVLYWRSKTTSSSSITSGERPIEQMPISTIIEKAVVVKVEYGLGLFVDLGMKGVRGLVHISKISDGKIETLSESIGPYKLGSAHKARVIGYNYMDGLFIVSMEPKVISQPFFRMEDVKAGQVVKGTIQKMMVNTTGVSGVLVNIAEGITGLVPEIHLADVHLQHPEKKFKEGASVTARVLSINLEKRQIRLTLKKTLVNSDVEPWTDYADLKPGLQAPGTIINITPAGAVVQFYGLVRAFLPVSEMSESYIQDPNQHFRNGQVVNVHIVSVEPSEGRMMISCKDPTVFGAAKEEALKKLDLAERVVGKVVEKTSDNIILDLQPSGLKAILPIEHLADKSSQKCQSAAGRIRIDQILRDLVVLSKQEAKRSIKLTGKPSLLRAAEEGKLPKTFEDVVEGCEVLGFVRNITPTGIFVQFADELTALLLKQHLTEEAMQLPDFGMQRNKSVSARVLSVDYNQKRFLLTLNYKPEAEEKESKPAQVADSYDEELSNAVDETSTTIADFILGKQTKAKIVSIKDTQLNVQLADSVQGRIDVSEIFDKWEDISDRKHPLKRFHTKQILPVRILGMHDSRNHRFLPITHRSKAPVFELTAKSSNQSSADLDILTINKVNVGSTWLVYVNNISEDCLWVNLSPNVRGRIRAMDVSDDVTALRDLSKNFPVGCVLRATVLKVDVENNRLDLSARSGASSGPKTFDDLSQGMVLPARVTKVTERQVMVQLSEALSAPIYLVDLADDYSKADPTIHQKNEILRVCVKSIDKPNKRITLSARPSKVLSSTLPVRDPDVTSASQLKVNDVKRGFIKNVADTGVFVSLASDVTAFVRVSDLSDAFLKDWKSGFEIDQLVEGKVIAVDPTLNHVQMSLKRSHLEKGYKPPLTFPDVRYGQVVTGKVRKVEDFGVFIVVDNSANVSGLCHRTKMSDQPGANPKKLYEQGDAVQAKVLSINKEKKQISFGLKASYFQNSGRQKETQDLDDIEVEDASNGDGANDGMNGVEIDGASDANEDEASESDVDLENVAEIDSDEQMDGTTNGGVQIAYDGDPTRSTSTGIKGLSAGGFDWTGGLSAPDDPTAQSETDTESLAPKKKKKRKRAEIKIDHTGSLDAHGPQSTADYERLLMSRPNSSNLWLQYMAFHLDLNEIPVARSLAERALATIAITEETEKQNIWIALLNLENTYGDPSSVSAVFARACKYNDSLTMHQRLASIYIQSTAYDSADTLFQSALKKHTQSPELYVNYATFLLTSVSAADRARALLPRAMQALPPHTHLDLTSKFAQLEFTTPHGDPERGRTVFETLLAQWPKRLDLWNVWLDLEIRQGDHEMVRRLFERVTMGKGTKLKPRKARFLFKKWLEWEGRCGDGKSQERVKALAGEFVKGVEREGELP